MGSKKKRKPYTPPDYAAMQGDWGPRTAAQTEGTEIVLLEGDNPNRVAYRRRVVVIVQMHKSGALSQRQFQAAEAVQIAHLKSEGLSSGGPLTERVDTSLDPSKAAEMQADVTTYCNRVSRAIPPRLRGIVRHVCIDNKSVSSYASSKAYHIHAAGLCIALDAVADEMGY